MSVLRAVIVPSNGASMRSKPHELLEPPHVRGRRGGLGLACRQGADGVVVLLPRDGVRLSTSFWSRDRPSSARDPRWPSRCPPGRAPAGAAGRPPACRCRRAAGPCFTARSDVDVPRLEVPVRPRVDRRVGERLDVAGQHELALRRRPAAVRHDVTIGAAGGERPSLQARLVADATRDAEIAATTDGRDPATEKNHWPRGAFGGAFDAHGVSSDPRRSALPAAVREAEDRRHEEERGDRRAAAGRR